jgi:hypothetical protein
MAGAAWQGFAINQREHNGRAEIDIEASSLQKVAYEKKTRLDMVLG